MPRAVDNTARAMAGEALSRLDNGGSGGGGTTIDAYSKLETDNLLNAKVDDVEFAPIKTLAESNEVNITYLAENKAEKAEVDTLSELVAEIDDELDLKANKADVYTKAETDTAVSNKVAEIIANAPEDFDTLKEMSDWIDSHEESASAMNTAIKQNTSDIANLKATDETTTTEIASIKNDIAINRTTLGAECKNLLNNKATSTTVNGVTFTVNSDKSITVNGTATANTQISLYTITDDGKYILTGCPKGGSGTTYCLSPRYVMVDDNVEYGVEYGDGLEIDFDSTKYKSITIRLQVWNGVTVSDLTFKPMLRYADIIDDTYEPYQPSLQEQVTALTERIVALESALTTATTQEA